MTCARMLVFAVGNPSRGDDALGPALLERLQAAGVDRGGDVELLNDFQLQVEHALDLEGRDAVLFVDAAYRSATGAAVTLEPIAASSHVPPASHSLCAPAVLCVAAQLHGSTPPAWQLAIEGLTFELGEGLSIGAERHLDRAFDMAMRWLEENRQGAVIHA